MKAKGFRLSDIVLKKYTLISLRSELLQSSSMNSDLLKLGLFTFAFLSFGPAHAEQEKLPLQISVKATVGSPQVLVAVEVGRGGKSKLKSGEAISVNEKTLTLHSNAKTGFEYSATVPRAESYEVKVKRPDGTKGAPISVPARNFTPKFSGQIVVGRDYAIPYEGAGISSRDKMLVKLISKQALFGMGPKKSIVLTGITDGTKIIIPASSTAKFKPGRVEILISISTEETSPSPHQKLNHLISVVHTLDIVKRP